ncbi:protein kinase family protein [Legionella hackeliae]|uniref:Putative Mitogen-activated protein kinase kinase kinase [STPK domain] n=1 Tax=Legionella hackeliae TaxID=449 RepID=A0A0A8URB9_LEGHA|nr:protein kinase family protein [Legionella hackeliae]KTD15345.1 Serine/threonine-protein kinase PknB [Legionella hackeliae]CEK11288.1 putative Mitogen-activated protein kinase kinase kinase [STPK domain] [Legionella hackeliae]STX48057.1 Serine/threonine-protein kinase pknB [Legionella hackeliae]
MTLSIYEIDLPSAPRKVKLDDLTPDGKLLTDEQTNQTIQHIEHKRKSSGKALKKAPFAQRFKKSELNIPYDIIAIDDDYYVIYYGAKRDAHLGIGGFGYVKLAQNIKTGIWVVLKLTVPDPKQREYLILQQAKLAIGYLERNVSKKNSFIEFQINRNSSWWVPQQANLLMTLAEGTSLADLFTGNYVLSVNKWIEIILQVLKEYEQIKKNGIVHKDLKLSNIFYSFAENKATIIDYGASRRKRFFLNTTKEKIIYTEGYTAPEIVKKGKYSEASDIYALGATFFYLLYLNDPKKSPINDPTLFQKLYSYCFSTMANPNAENRPSTEETITFFEEVQHSLSNLLPKPFRKIALLPVSEYLHYRDEAKTLDENQVPIVETSNSPPLKEENVTLPKQENYFTSFITSTFALISNYFYSTNTTQPQDVVDKSKEGKSELRPPKEIKKRYDRSFITSLKLFDEVWLIDTSKRTKKEYIQLRRELEEQRIIVGQRGFLSDNEDLSLSLPSIFNSFCKDKKSKQHRYFCITAQKEIKPPPGICSITLQPEEDEPYYQNIIETYANLEICEEYNRIKSSLTSLSMGQDIVKNTIVDLDKHFTDGNLSLSYLKNGLKELKTQLTTLERSTYSESHNRASTVFFSKLVQSQTSQYIKKIDEDIEEWVDSYGM